MFSLFRSKTGGSTFWDWLASHRVQVREGLAKDPPATIRELGKHFARAYPDLVWELSPTSGPTGEEWCLCLSADGKQDLFPQVLQAVRGAPEIPGWTIKPFRQRGSIEARIRIGEVVLGPDDIWCNARPSADGVALVLWIRGLTRETEGPIKAAICVLLDNALGEWDAAMKIKELHHAPAPADPRGEYGAVPLRELPALIDRMTGAARPTN